MPNFMSDPLPVENYGERHIPAVLLLDKSGSMYGDPIAELNQGLVDFGTALAEDSLAMGRAEVSVISFDSNVNTEMGFRPASEYAAPTLTANGGTSMNKAINAGLDAIEERKQLYKSQGISWYRPWLFLLTDGEAGDTGLEESTKARLRSAIEQKKVVYMPMAIGSHADQKKLQEYYPVNAPSKPVLTASAENFREAFVWLSNSIGVVSHSDPMQSNEVALPATPSTITIVGI